MSASLRNATVEVGRALVFTSIVLCAGFASMLFGSFVGMMFFGLLSMITIVFALAADLLLLPVVLRWYAGENGAIEAREFAEVGDAEGTDSGGSRRAEAMSRVDSDLAGSPGG